jgi:hypothetical protein
MNANFTINKRSCFISISYGLEGLVSKSPASNFTASELSLCCVDRTSIAKNFCFETRS